MKRKTKSTKTTQSALARALGVSRQLVAAHCRKPEAPDLNDTAGWVAYFAQHGRTGSAPSDLRRAIAAEKLEILKETKTKLARENLMATRDCGELIPRELVEKLLFDFGGILGLALRGFHDCGFAVYNAKDPDEVRIVMGKASQELTFASMVALRGGSGLKFPDWMLKKFSEAVQSAPYAEATYSQMGVFAADFIVQHGHDRRQAFLKKLDAKKRYAEATDPGEKARIWSEEIAPSIP